MFPYHYGSHATLLLVCILAMSFSFHTTMVLTQQDRYEALCKEILFPYHYGSHATRDCGDQIRVAWFPYHYGSHATRWLYQSVYHRRLFPYHYGSHATSSRTTKLNCVHWCFHTTMVLTQHRCICRMYRRYCGFHTTMVLTQHELSGVPGEYHMFPYHYGSHATSKV